MVNQSIDALFLQQLRRERGRGRGNGEMRERRGVISVRIEYLSLKGRGRGREEGERDRERRRWEEGRWTVLHRLMRQLSPDRLSQFPPPPSPSLSPFMPIIDSMTSLDCSFSSLTTNFTPSLLFFASTFPPFPFHCVVWLLVQGTGRQLLICHS